MEVLSLRKGFEIIGLGLFIEKYRMLVIADMHIGYEESLIEQGIHLPFSQYRKMKRMLSELINNLEPETVVLLGDVKHEFGTATRQEWTEVMDLLDFLKKYVKKVLVVRGNHDNFLIPILKKKNVPLYDPSYEINDILFIHGHKEISLNDVTQKIIIMGHEHPAIILRDELGIKHKFKCFLHGKINGKEIIVLPSFSPLMPGTEVNITPRARFLSPLLRNIDISDFRVYVSEPNVGIYDFGKLKNLYPEELYF